jgi:hypothetical protein
VPGQAATRDAGMFVTSGGVRQLQRRGALTVSLPLIAGSNTIEFANAASYAPDFDRIIVAATLG